MSEKASSLLECFSECSLYCSKKRNRPRWQMKQASLALEASFIFNRILQLPYKRNKAAENQQLC